METSCKNFERGDVAYLCDIPTHRIRDFAPYGISARLYGAVSDGAWDIIENFPVHRDDHYFFLIVEEGSGSLDIDFQRIQLKRGELYVVTPGQLHGNIDARGCRGWVVLISPDFISGADRDVFGKNMFRVRPHSLTDDEYLAFRSILDLMVFHCDKAVGQLHFERLLHAMGQLFIGMAVKALSSGDDEFRAPDSRLQHIACEFKMLIRRHCYTEKSVQFYAGALNITSGYLNEIIRKLTGRPSSYWIREEIILEAKRLLAVTDLSAKEISYRLGYDNYCYFNRLFHKATGLTPLQFRAGNHK